MSPGALLWEEIPNGSDLEQYRNRDIFTEKTARQILDNNDLIAQ